MSDNYSIDLPAGIELNQYRIIKTLGHGGFSITYLALDTKRNCQVVIKEHLPTLCAHRDVSTGHVYPHNLNKEQDTFQKSLKAFQREAKILLEIRHPHIVHVRETFDALGTSYYVMDDSGTVLTQAAPPTEEMTEEWLKPILLTLLDTLRYLHKKNILHRDIKPSNILLSPHSEPIFIDFGTARNLKDNRTFTTIGSTGYTPVEQISASLPHGPWTDLYALGATCYRLITGEGPPDCILRLANGKDPYRKLSARVTLYKRYSREFLHTIDKALLMDAKQRWQHADEWIKELQRKKSSMPDTVTSHHVTKRKSPWKKVFYITLISGGLLAWGLFGGSFHPVTFVHQCSLLTQGITPKKYYRQLINAIETNQTEKLQQLLDAGADIHEREHKNEFPLLLCAQKGHVESLQILLNNGADCQQKNQEGMTALHFAANAECVKTLLQAGSDLHALSNDHCNALHVVSGVGFADSIPALIEAGIDVNSTGYNKFTPLFFAANAECVQALLKAGAKIDIKGVNKCTPLHLIRTGDAAQALIDAGAHVEATTSEGYTPLHIAVDAGHDSVMNALLKAKANVHAVNKQGYTPLHVTNSIQAVQSLLAAGADLHARDQQNNTVLHTTAQKGYNKAILPLIDAGLHVDTTGYKNRTPLHGSPCRSALELLKAGATVDAVDDDGATPLSLAAASNNTELIKILLDAKANIEARNNQGNTPLLIAAEQGHLNAVKLLLEKGANPIAINNNGISPISITPNTEILNLLRKVSQKAL